METDTDVQTEKLLEYKTGIVEYAAKILQIATKNYVFFYEKAETLLPMIQKLREYYSVLPNPDFLDQKVMNNLKLCVIYLIFYINKGQGDPPRRVFSEETLINSLKETFNIIEGKIQKKELIKEYNHTLGDSEYYRKLISENIENIDALKTINRLNFQKTGSELIPLGGKFKGLYLVRIITQQAFNTWKTVYEAGIPCEELVKDKQGRYRTVTYPDGRIAVFTKYAGENLEKYRFKSAEEKEFIYKERQQIITQLEINRIWHGHLHNGNFCVLYEKGIPKVRAIDFDSASQFDN